MQLSGGIGIRKGSSDALAYTLGPMASQQDPHAQLHSTKEEQPPVAPPHATPVGAAQGSAQRLTKVRSTWPLYLAFFLVAGLVGTTIAWGFLTESLAALGIPDPGHLTTAGLPFLRAVGWMLAALAVGSFLTSSFLISPRLDPRPTTTTQKPNTPNTQDTQEPLDPESAEALARAAGAVEVENPVTRHDEIGLRRAFLSADGHIAARTGAYATLGFALIAFVMVPLALSDVSGTPFFQTLQPAYWGTAISQVSTSLAWFWVGVIAGITGLLSLATNRWGSQPLCLLGSILMIVPLGMEGHSAAGGDHDYGTNSYLWHLIFMVLWVGGLMALIAHGRRLGPDLAKAVQRYSTIALVAVIVMTASGLINAAIRIEWEDWLTTGYGLIITAKAVGVILLAFMGFIHRQITIPRLEKEPKLFLRVAIVEVFMMAIITGIAISMGRTPPPPPRDPNLSQMALVLGYDLYVEPNIYNVWTMWRFDIMFGSIGIALAATYLYWVIQLRRRTGTRWPISRTIWWMLGCVTLVITVCSGIGLNMPATFSMHMVNHMILSMVIPVFWVLGTPINLLLAAVPAAKPGQPGLREWIQAGLDSPILRFIMHPGFNTVQFLVIYYLLYLTPFYSVLVSEHAGHLGMNFAFLISGYMYYWEMIGPDPTPDRRSAVSRLAWLVFSMPFHLYFGVYLMQLNTVLAEDFYSTLGLPWAIDLLHDQKVGGGIAWASGSFPLVVVFGTLFRQWLSEDRVKERKHDAHVAAQGDVDDEMEAYNRMLAQMNAGEYPQT